MGEWMNEWINESTSCNGESQTERQADFVLSSADCYQKGESGEKEGMKINICDLNPPSGTPTAKVNQGNFHSATYASNQRPAQEQRYQGDENHTHDDNLPKVSEK